MINLFKKYFSIILLLAVVISSCDGKRGVLARIYNNRDKLMQLCQHKSLLVSRGGNYYFLYTYSKNKTNAYFMALNNDKLIWLRDSIEYKSEINNWNKSPDSSSRKKQILSFTTKLKNDLQAFNVSGFRTDFAELGEPLQLYLDDGKTVSYIPDIEKISSVDSLYRKSLKKIDKDWYYTD